MSKSVRRGLVRHLVARVAEHVLRAGLPGRDASTVVEHEHRVVLDAVEHQAHPRLDFAEPAVGGAALALAALGNQARVVERRGGVPRKLAEQPQVVLGKQRPAPLDDDHAPQRCVVELIGATSALAPSPAMAEANSGSHASRRPDCSPSLVMARPTRPAAGVSGSPTNEGTVAAWTIAGQASGSSRSATMASEWPTLRAAACSEIGGRQAAALLRRPIRRRAQISRLLEPLPARAQIARRRECQEVADADPADQQLVKPVGVTDRRDE